MRGDISCDNSTGIVPVVLAGGRGTRLRPLVSARRPKPFLKLGGRQSFFQKTYERIGVFERPVIVTEQAFLPYLYQDLRGMRAAAAWGRLHDPRIIVEPEGRNTGPAIMAAAHILRADNPLMLVVPSDHFVSDMKAFRDSVAQAAAQHRHGRITLLGVPPRYPSAHFGYMHREKCRDGQGEGHSVRFTEKPSAAHAKMLIEHHNALWHSGMFLVYAQDLCRICEQQSSELFNCILEALPENLRASEGIFTLKKDSFVKAPSISIDYTILEKTAYCDMFQMQIAWSDLGTWSGMVRHALGA